MDACKERLLTDFNGSYWESDIANLDSNMGFDLQVLSDSILGAVMNGENWPIDLEEISEDDLWKGISAEENDESTCIRSEHSYSAWVGKESEGTSLSGEDSSGEVSEEGLPSPRSLDDEMVVSNDDFIQYDVPTLDIMEDFPIKREMELAEPVDSKQTVPIIVVSEQAPIRKSSLLQAVTVSLGSKSSQTRVLKNVQLSQPRYMKDNAVVRPVAPVKSAVSGRRSLLTKSLVTSNRGELFLTDEERRTFISEGYPIPTRLPLTRAEEQNLKRVRRKIKNKISAQESRRKKRDYIELLEKRSEVYCSENNQLKRKVEQLESKNRSLMSQLQKFQLMVSRATSKTLQSPGGVTGTCLVMLAIFFVMCLGVWAPAGGHTDNSWPLLSWLHQHRQQPVLMVDHYATPSVKSRMLLHWPKGEDDDDGDKTSSYREIVLGWFKGLCMSSALSDDALLSSVEEDSYNKELLYNSEVLQDAMNSVIVTDSLLNSNRIITSVSGVHVANCTI